MNRPRPTPTTSPDGRTPPASPPPKPHRDGDRRRRGSDDARARQQLKERLRGLAEDEGDEA